MILLVGILILQAVATSSDDDGYCELVSKMSTDGIGTIECSGHFEELAELSSQLKRISEPVSVVHFKELSLDTIPPDWIKDGSNSEISTFIIDNSHIKLLSVPELGVSPFKAIQNTIQSFEVYESQGVSAWNWTSLPVMIQLHTLIIYKSNIIYIPDEFYFSPNLFHLQVSESGVKYLHPKSFSRLQHLRLLSLSGNKIETVERSMFSRPAPYLWSLDLSDNLLETLPGDMFSEMPELSEIKLDGNRLVSFVSVKQVWKQLTQLWLQGNNFSCRYNDICWFSTKKKGPLFFSSTVCKEKSKYDSTIIRKYVSDICKAGN